MSQGRHIDKFLKSLENLQKRQGANTPNPTDHCDSAADNTTNAHQTLHTANAAHSPCSTRLSKRPIQHTAHAAHASRGPARSHVQCSRVAEPILPNVYTNSSDAAHSLNIVSAEELFQKQFKEYIVYPKKYQPMICTLINKKIKQSKNLIIYKPRISNKGTLVFHLGEGHLEKNFGNIIKYIKIK